MRLSYRKDSLIIHAPTEPLVFWVARMGSRIGITSLYQARVGYNTVDFYEWCWVWKTPQ